MAKHALKDPLAVVLVEQEAFLRGSRATSESLWQQIAELVIPRRATFQEEVTEGVLRNRKILDSTAARSLELFASFIHTLLNNPSVRWIRVRVSSAPELNDRLVVRKWLEEVSKVIMTELSGPQANIYSHLHQVYLDLGAFGTAVLFLDGAPGGGLRVRYHQLSGVVIAEGESGHIDTAHLTMDFTPRQARQKWPGRDLGKSVMDAKGKDQHKPLKFLHSVFPNTDLVADLLDIPVPDESLDGIICHQVLEHVTDPARVVRELHRVLRPGGRLLLSTPFLYPIHEDGPVKDYFRYTGRGLKELLKDFREVDLDCAGPPNFPVGYCVLGRK